MPRLQRRQSLAAVSPAAQAATPVAAPVFGAPSSADLFVVELRRQLDASWYIDYYHVLVDEGENLFEAALAHYLKIGSRFSFSPTRGFDEAEYRLQNSDVDTEIAAGRMLSGFQHYVLCGKREGRRATPIKEISRWRAAHPMHSDTARRVRAYFDPRWYVERYPEVARMLATGVMPTPFMHYLTEGTNQHYSPNNWFDEAWYLAAYPDVAAAKARGEVPSGFFHHLSAGRTEGRLPKADPVRELEAKYPGLTKPVGLDQLRSLEAKIAPLRTVWTRKGTRRLNVLVPTLDKNIMFGGYIALLNFLVAMQDRGWPIRILVLEDAQVNTALARLQFAGNARISALLESVEIVNLTGNEQAVEVTAQDRFLAYSMWMAHHAHQLAEMTGRRFAFFIQEYEPVFHAHDSWRALGASAYLKPHFAIFNSETLRGFFRERRHGVYSESLKKGDADSVVFEHTLSVSGTPSAADFARDGVKRLLFYARPEAHAARNLFEIGVVALRRAIAAGSFGPEWQFDGVGTLGYEGMLELGGGHHMRVRPKLEHGDYCKALRGYDVGLSLMYAPHPSVVPFEMAACGVVTVTNVFCNRDAAHLRNISPNLVPSELSIEALTSALHTAQARSSNFKARIAGASRPWVTDWKASFSDTVLDAVEKGLK